MQLSPNLTQKWSTMSPGNPFFGVKRSKVTVIGSMGLRTLLSADLFYSFAVMRWCPFDTPAREESQTHQRPLDCTCRLQTIRGAASFRTRDDSDAENKNSQAECHRTWRKKRTVQNVCIDGMWSRDWRVTNTDNDGNVCQENNNNKKQNTSETRRLARSLDATRSRLICRRGTARRCVPLEEVVT